jgi:hypothetical protein
MSLFPLMLGLSLLVGGASVASDESDLWTLAAEPARAQQAEEPAVEVDATAGDNPQVDTPDVDSEGSIEDAADRRGWSVEGDIRAGYAYSDRTNRASAETDEDELTGRFRIGSTIGFTRNLRARARFAGICSTEGCGPDFEWSSSIPKTSGLDVGDATLDELFLHWFPGGRFDVAIGRMQTKFVTRGGVFSKSLDRNDSNSANVNWTDGFHGTVRARRGWVSHLILQANRANGTSSVRREPLDFGDDGSHVSYFLAFENVEAWGPFVQRALDISYLPDSLMKDGSRTGRIEDYPAIVARLAARWPREREGPGLLVTGEVGHAPETPTAAAVDLPGSGDVDGLAWAVTASVMDLRPGHSIGVNLARADAGWLLSPQYRRNDRLSEIRYRWQTSRTLNVEVRARWRKELEQEVGTAQRRDELDVFARMTWQFTLKKP